VNQDRPWRTHGRCIVIGRISLGMLLLPSVLTSALASWSWSKVGLGNGVEVPVWKGLPVDEMLLGWLMAAWLAIAVAGGLYSWIKWRTTYPHLGVPHCGQAASMLGILLLLPLVLLLLFPPTC